MSITRDKIHEIHLAESLIEAGWKHQRRFIYTALEDYEFTWDENDVLKFDELWKQGDDLQDIAERLARPVEDVKILMFDRLWKGAINERSNGMGKSKPQPNFTKERYLELKEQGLTQHAIRQEFEVSTTTFYYWLRKWGLKNSPKRRTRR